MSLSVFKQNFFENVIYTDYETYGESFPETGYAVFLKNAETHRVFPIYFSELVVSENDAGCSVNYSGKNLEDFVFRQIKEIFEKRDTHRTGFSIIATKCNVSMDPLSPSDPNGSFSVVFYKSGVEHPNNRLKEHLPKIDGAVNSMESYRLESYRLDLKKHEFLTIVPFGFSYKFEVTSTNGFNIKHENFSEIEHQKTVVFNISDSLEKKILQYQNLSNFFYELYSDNCPEFCKIFYNKNEHTCFAKYRANELIISVYSNNIRKSTTSCHFNSVSRIVLTISH